MNIEEAQALAAAQGTRVVHLKVEPHTRRIDRRTLWGNPHPLKGQSEAERTACLLAYVRTMREDGTMLARVGDLRGEVVAAMHSSERHAFIMALEALLVEQGVAVVQARTKGDLSLPGARKPSASGLAPWEILERFDAWALTVEGLRVTSALWGERQRQIRLGNQGLTVGYQGQRWLVWDHGQPTIEVMPEELLDRVVELVRSMRV